MTNQQTDEQAIKDLLTQVNDVCADFVGTADQAGLGAALDEMAATPEGRAFLHGLSASVVMARELGKRNRPVTLDDLRFAFDVFFENIEEGE